MIELDADRVRHLRGVRMFAIVFAAVCFSAVAIGYQLVEDIVLLAICGVFVVRALNLTADLRDTELRLSKPRKEAPMKP